MQITSLDQLKRIRVDRFRIKFGAANSRTIKTLSLTFSTEGDSRNDKNPTDLLSANLAQLTANAYAMQHSIQFCFV